MKQYLYFVFQRNASKERVLYQFIRTFIFIYYQHLRALEESTYYSTYTKHTVCCHTGNQKKKVIFYFSFQYKIIHLYIFFFRKPLQIDSTNLVSTYHSASYAGCNSKNQNKSTNYKKTEQRSSGGGNSKSPVKATMMVHTGLVFVI